MQLSSVRPLRLTICIVATERVDASYLIIVDLIKALLDMTYKVLCSILTGYEVFDDRFDGEYSGIEHNTREAVARQAREARQIMKDEGYVEPIVWVEEYGE